MPLDAMTPDPDWDSNDWADALDRLRSVSDGLTVRVWCGDWCGDCRRLLPPFSAALDELDIRGDSVKTYAVEKLADGSKVGNRVEDYRIERTPTVIFERDGKEIARFEEGRSLEPIIESLAEQLVEIEQSTG